jgi:hypothetical protein
MLEMLIPLCIQDDSKTTALVPDKPGTAWATTRVAPTLNVILNANAN